MSRLTCCILLVAVALFATPADAGKTPERSKICQIGSTGTYIPEGEECIDTPAKCEQKGGIWRGSISGRGRSVGCDLPTKDSGQKCTDNSQCESICIAHDQSNKNCSCYGRTIVLKGQQPDTCSFTGVIPGAIVD